MSAAGHEVPRRILSRWAGRFHAVAAVIRSADGMWCSSCRHERNDAAWLDDAGLLLLDALLDLDVGAHELPDGAAHDALLEALDQAAMARAQLYAAAEWIESDHDAKRESAQHLRRGAYLLAQSIADQLDSFELEQKPGCSRNQLVPCPELTEVSHA